MPKVSKNKKYNRVKGNITLIFIFMICMFLYCFLMYTGGDKNKFKEINTSLEYVGGSALITDRLQKIIPYSAVTNLELKTAYQNKKVTVSDISNDIFLNMAYDNSSEKNHYNFNQILLRIYGNNLFIVNEDFNVNGTTDCKFKEQNMTYNCENVKYDGIIYDASREVNNLIIKDKDYTLEENIIFYSKELLNNEVTYKIYRDGTYQESILSFTEEVLDNQSLKDYIKANYSSYIKKYKSNFKVNNSTYIWLSTEIESEG